MIQIISSLLLTGLLASSIPFNLTAEEKGLAIAQEVEKNFDNFGDSTFEQEIILKNRHGKEIVRHFRTLLIEVPGDGDKIVFLFDSPADVRGVAILVVTHKFALDDQWVYIPRLKRVKRISSQNKGSSVMGSEFANEDLGRAEPEKFTHRWIRDEVYEGEPCFVIERYPVEKSSIYSRQILWIDQAEHRIRKIEYYDKKNAHAKTMIFSGYKRYESKYWRWDELKMVNHITGDSSRHLYKNWKFRTGLRERDFTVNSLKRER